MKQQKKQSGITVFYSYASADREWRDHLATHLSQLRHDGLIKEWHNQEILPGSDYIQETRQVIGSAQIILLLISADFLASDVQYHGEMQHALERHRRGEAHIVPILVRPCDWQHSPFAHLQCLPRNTKPVTLWDNQDEAFVTIVESLRRIIMQQQFPLPRLSDEQRQNRARLLKRVRTIWVKGLLEKSLHRMAWIDLHLQEQPDALENPWRFEVQELDHEPYPLPIGMSIVDVYDEADGELLILGEPGSGKTTLLLQLAQVLLDRAEADERHPMPIVFHLSSWARKRETLATWLVEELKTKYQVPRQVGQFWIEANQILPLLDGLDEVADLARVACIQAITTYRQGHPSQIGLPLIICCRSKEYQALRIPLPLQRAVRILPLSDEQVHTYLSNTQADVEGIQYLLRADADLAALAHRPLVLSIIVLAFQGKHLFNFVSDDNFVSEKNFVGASQEQLLQIVFAAYVERMCERREKLPSWMQGEFLHWLIYLAKQLRQQRQTIFSLEDLRPDWLEGPQRLLYWWSVRLVAGLLFWLSFGSVALISGLLFFGPFDGVLLFGLFAGLPFGLLAGLLAGPTIGLSPSQLTEGIHSSPNEGIRRSGKNGLMAGLYVWLLFGTLFGMLVGIPVWVFSGSLGGLLFGMLVGLLFGPFFALLAGLPAGLNTFIQHFVLRFWLWHTNCLPWDMVAFLDEASERLLLRKVGGSYIFVHRLLLEYFATLGETRPPENTSL